MPEYRDEPADPGDYLPPQDGILWGGLEPPDRPEVDMGPLTEEEHDQVAYLRAAFSDQVDAVRVAPMRVLHDGRARVALVAVKEKNGEMLVTPLALLLDAGLFEQMTPTLLEVPTRVYKDDTAEED